MSSRYIRELGLNNPLLLLALLVAAVIGILYWFFGTEQGPERTAASRATQGLTPRLMSRAHTALRATGSNPNMARAQGIDTNWSKVLGLVVSNALVALSAARR